MKWLGYSTGIKVNAVIKKVEGEYVAYFPHLPRCFSTGESVGEALINLRGIMKNHLGSDFEIKPSISSLSDSTLEIAG